MPSRLIHLFEVPPVRYNADNLFNYTLFKPYPTLKEKQTNFSLGFSTLQQKMESDMKVLEKFS